MKIILQEKINIKELVTEIKNGKTFVYPTETCYGLGCDATNDVSVQKLFQIKHRQEGKTMLVVFPEIAMAREYVDWNDMLQEISEKYWPGALTVVSQVKSSSKLASGVIAPDKTIAFRISSHPLVQDITTHLGLPIVSTSANIAGEDSPYVAQEIIERFQKESIVPDTLINAGILPHTAPSTIIKIVDGQIQVLRQGEVQINFE